MALGYVGVIALRLEMPWVSNLKEKRSLVRPVVERLKSRFPVTAARLDGLDTHDWEVIGITTISNDYQWVQETLKMAADFVTQGDYTVREEYMDIIPLTDDDPEREEE